MNRRPWKRLAARRAARRRGRELLPPPMPSLEPPDDDREFAPAADGREEGHDEAA